MVRLAFYKAPGNFFDKLIRVLTRSPYSHVELVFGADLFFSASSRDGEVRFRYINPEMAKWDFVRLDLTQWQEDNLKELCRDVVGKSYDWLGVLRFVLPLLRQSWDKWFCSEVCLDRLQHVGLFTPGPLAHRVSPGALYKLAAPKSPTSGGQ